MAELAPIRHQGEVVEWSDEKKCGFIRPRGAKDNDPLVFVGSASLASRKELPRVGSIMTYERVQLPKAGNRHLRTQFRAENVAFLGEETLLGPDNQSEVLLLRLGLVYLLVLGGLSLLTTSGLYLLMLSVLASVISFALYWADKAAAKREGRRVSENVLHLWSVLGGWPGAAIAQRHFRHKTRKRSFRAWYLATVVANLVIAAFVEVG